MLHIPILFVLPEFLTVAGNLHDTVSNELSLLDLHECICRSTLYVLENMMHLKFGDCVCVGM